MVQAPATPLGNAVPPETAGRLLVAVSGGPDSTALLSWLRELGRRVVAAHYDHALREGSAADAGHVARLCAALGVELVSERRRAPVPAGSVQAGARTLRYDFLERARTGAGCDWIAIAHTADDVVEGALIHLLRGSGLAGLRGMPERRPPFVRPLLHTWRREVDAYLAARALTAIQDPSNARIDRYTRARVRHILVPALERERPGISRRLRAVAARAAEMQERLEEEAGALGADRSRLRSAPRIVRLEAYRHLYGRSPALERRHLDAVDRLLLEGRTGDGVDLPAGLRARLLPERLEIAGPEPEPEPARLEARACPGCAGERALHLRPDVDAATLRIGHRRPGLRLRTRSGTRKLQDLLVDAKVPRHLRDRLPLVFSGDRLAWVPGVAADTDLSVPSDRPGLHLRLVNVGAKWGW